MNQYVIKMNQYVIKMNQDKRVYWLGYRKSESLRYKIQIKGIKRVDQGNLKINQRNQLNTGNIIDKPK